MPGVSQAKSKFYNRQWDAIMLEDNRKDRAFQMCYELLADPDLGDVDRAGLHLLLSEGPEASRPRKVVLRLFKHLYDNAEHLKSPQSLADEAEIEEMARKGLARAEEQNTLLPDEQVDQPKVGGNTQLAALEKEACGTMDDNEI